MATKITDRISGKVITSPIILNDVVLANGGVKAKKEIVNLLEKTSYMPNNSHVSFANLNKNGKTYWSNVSCELLDHKTLCLICNNSNERKAFVFFIEQTVLRRLKESTRTVKINSNYYKEKFDIQLINNNCGFINNVSKISYNNFLRLIIEY